jgi:AcrR family transcriptional regulator
VSHPTDSPVRRADPARRERLTTAALELLEAEGPEAMTTRRVGQLVGASSMAVYSEFGSLGGLVASVVNAGFDALADALAVVGTTDDPVQDLWRTALAYRVFALARPHLYRAMYGLNAPGGYRRTGDELALGSETFGSFVATAERARRQGLVVGDDSFEMALAGWTWLHGWVVNELAGYPDVYPHAPLVHMQIGFTALLRGFGASTDLELPLPD